MLAGGTAGHRCPPGSIWCADSIHCYGWGCAGSFLPTNVGRWLAATGNRVTANALHPGVVSTGSARRTRPRCSHAGSGPANHRLYCESRAHPPLRDAQPRLSNALPRNVFQFADNELTQPTRMPSNRPALDAVAVTWCLRCTATACLQRGEGQGP
jgi:hypothetical protein